MRRSYVSSVCPIFSHRLTPNEAHRVEDPYSRIASAERRVKPRGAAPIPIALRPCGVTAPHGCAAQASGYGRKVPFRLRPKHE